MGTTFKPRSLADLFKHRDGIKIGDPDSEDDDEQFERPTAESFVTSTTSRPVFTPSRNQASSGIETLRNRKNNNNNKFSNRFKPSTEQSIGGFGSPTSRPKLGGFKSRTTKGPTVGDLLAKIPKDTLSSSLLPKDFQERRPGFGSRRPSISSGGSIVQDDVSAFLPPGFKLDETTTSTTTDTSLISDILSSIEIDDSLLPKDFNFKPARPKPPRLFNSNKPSSGAGTTTTTTSTSSSSSSSSSDSSSSSSGSLLESLGSLVFDDASQFLPPGYNDNANKEGSGTESSSTSSSPSNNNSKKKPDNSKLPIESFFDNLPSD